VGLVEHKGMLEMQISH